MHSDLQDKFIFGLCCLCAAAVELCTVLAIVLQRVSVEMALALFAVNVVIAVVLYAYVVHLWRPRTWKKGFALLAAWQSVFVVLVTAFYVWLEMATR
jgi:hypothetical protein